MTIDDYPASFRLMASIQATLAHLGFAPDQFMVDFGLAKNDDGTPSVLQGIVVLLTPDRQNVLAVVACGNAAGPNETGEQYRKVCEDSWDEFAELWNALPDAARDAVWFELQPPDAVATIGEAMVQRGVLTRAALDLRLAEMPRAEVR